MLNRDINPENLVEVHINCEFRLDVQVDRWGKFRERLAQEISLMRSDELLEFVKDGECYIDNVMVGREV